MSLETPKHDESVDFEDVTLYGVETDETSVKQIFSVLVIQSAQLILLAAFGVISLGFQLRGKNARKENTPILISLSTIALLIVNCLIWYRVIYIAKHNLKSIAEGNQSGVGHIFLALMMAIFIIAADTAIVLQMISSIISNHQISSDVPSSEISDSGEEDTPASVVVADDVDDQPVYSTYFRSTTDHCEICTRDFNSWCSQRVTSTFDTFEGCFDSIFDTPKPVQRQVHRPMQVAKTSSPVEESPLRETEKVNVCKASGGCGSLFIGPLDEELGGGFNRATPKECNPSSVLVENGEKRDVHKNSCHNANENRWEACRLLVGSKKLWTKVRENEKFRYSMWMKAAGLICAFALIHNAISTIITIQNFAREVCKYSHVAEFLVEEGQQEENIVSLRMKSGVIETSRVMSETNNDRASVDQIGDQSMGEFPGFLLMHSDLNTGRNLVLIQSRYFTRVAQFFLSLMDDFCYTVILGYIISTCIGLWSLYHVFVSQKEMIVKLNKKEEMSCRGEVCLQQFWQRSRPKYYVGSAVYFLGTLVSTAIIQQHVIGILISVFLGMAIHIADIYRALEPSCCKGASLLVVLLSSALISHFLGNYMLSDGLRVCHPRWFFLFVFTFSLVNFVLGALHGAYRLIFLFLSTIITISRLDVSSFQSTRGLDNGHNTFMSMLLLTHKIQAIVRAPQVVYGE